MSEMNPTRTLAEATFRITTQIPLKLKRRSGRKTILQTPDICDGDMSGKVVGAGLNVPLLQGLSRAFYWQRLLDAGEVSSGSEIAQLEGLDPSTVNELLRLTLLDPSLVLDIMEGRQPQKANMMWFTRNALPDLWQKQFS